MITLYQFPISHFCEKVRWALTFKGLDYKAVTLIPGLHLIQTKRFSSNSCVPILKHRKEIIQNSSEIINYLDHTFPENPLTPYDSEEVNQAMEWEKFADEEIGPHVRRLVYHSLLKHPDIVIPFFAHDGPWYGKTFLKTSYPQLTKLMRKGMQIYDDEAADSAIKLKKAVANVREHLAGRRYMVGNQFSRADLAVASLLAPLTLQKEYGIDWPDTVPEDFQDLLNSYQDQLYFVKDWYSEHR